MHQLLPARSSRLALSGFILLAMSIFAGACKRQAADISNLGTFRMGEKVHLGAVTYDVLEAQWKPALGDGTTGRPPKHRYLFIRLSITNNGTTAISIPGLRLKGSGGTEYSEVSEGLGDVKDWLGLLRTIEPSLTTQGYIVFDAPMASYSLQITDAGEPGQEKSGQVQIPVQLE